MKSKWFSYILIATAIMLILVGGYLRLHAGNSYALMFIGGMIFMFLRLKN